MKEGIKKIILYSIAGLLLLITILVVSLHIQQKLYMSIFWVCYTGMALISLGIIIKKPNLVLSQIVILMIPDLLWVVDFIIIMVTGNSPLGLAGYFAAETRPLFQDILSLQHVFTVPLAIFSLSLMKMKKNYNFLLISFVELIFFFLLGMLIPAGNGVNCLPTPATCTSLVFPNFIPYPLIWLIVGFSFVMISFFIMASFPFIRKVFYKINYAPSGG